MCSFRQFCNWDLDFATRNFNDNTAYSNDHPCVSLLANTNIHRWPLYMITYIGDHCTWLSWSTFFQNLYRGVQRHFILSKTPTRNFNDNTACSNDHPCVSLLANTNIHRWPLYMITYIGDHGTWLSWSTFFQNLYRGVQRHFILSKNQTSSFLCQQQQLQFIDHPVSCCRWYECIVIDRDHNCETPPDDSSSSVLCHASTHGVSTRA